MARWTCAPPPRFQLDPYPADGARIDPPRIHSSTFLSAASVGPCISLGGFSGSSHERARYARLRSAQTSSMRLHSSRASAGPRARDREGRRSMPFIRDAQRSWTPAPDQLHRLGRDRAPLWFPVVGPAHFERNPAPRPGLVIGDERLIAQQRCRSCSGRLNPGAVGSEFPFGDHGSSSVPLGGFFCDRQ